MTDPTTAHLTAGTRLVRAAGALSAPLDDEIVLLAPALDEYVALDAIGRRVWELLETARSVEELSATLAEEFDAPAERIAADVAPFLDELVAGGLVHVLDA